MPASTGRTSRERSGEPSAASRAGNAESNSSSKLTVNINAATEQALRHVAEREGVTMTEALRRLVSCGDLVYRATKEDNADVLIRHGKEIERIHLL